MGGRSSGVWGLEGRWKGDGRETGGRRKGRRKGDEVSERTRESYRVKVERSVGAGQKALVAERGAYSGRGRPSRSGILIRGIEVGMEIWGHDDTS